MTPGIQHEGGNAGTLTKDPVEYQTQVFRPNLQKLRMECEKAGNWPAIKPLLDNLVGSFDNFIERTNA